MEGLLWRQVFFAFFRERLYIAPWEFGDCSAGLASWVGAGVRWITAVIVNSSAAADWATAVIVDSSAATAQTTAVIIECSAGVAYWAIISPRNVQQPSILKTVPYAAKLSTVIFPLIQ